MILQRSRRATTRAAFTLMEMLVVVAILVVLAGAAVPIYMKYLEDSKKDRAALDVKTLEAAVQKYKVRFGNWPTSLGDLVQNGYLSQESLIDPWGQEYEMNANNIHLQKGPQIRSQGPPGESTPISNFEQ